MSHLRHPNSYRAQPVLVVIGTGFLNPAPARSGIGVVTSPQTFITAVSGAATHALRETLKPESERLLDRRMDITRVGWDANADGPFRFTPATLASSDRLALKNGMS